MRLAGLKTNLDCEQLEGVRNWGQNPPKSQRVSESQMPSVVPHSRHLGQLCTLLDLYAWEPTHLGAGNTSHFPGQGKGAITRKSSFLKGGCGRTPELLGS